VHGIPDNIRTNDKLFDISQHIINSASAAANYRNALAFKKTPHIQVHGQTPTTHNTCTREPAKMKHQEGHLVQQMPLEHFGDRRTRTER
jgi:hypothetical protein